MTASQRLPAVIGGKYRPLRQIGKGGMGFVYEVVHANTGEHLALKLMSARSLLTPELVERFRREARIPISIKSENVVRIVDADVASELEGAPFLVMEMLIGSDLEQLCANGRPSSDEALGWLRDIARPLDRAHLLGIVHRDLKPENLFLAERDDRPPIVKILDFGVAKMDDEASAGYSTASGQILGTPRYMAPEQAAGSKEITPAVDRFALGLIAFRLLCGRPYFADPNWVTLLTQVTRGPTAPPSAMGCDLGAAFDAWFMRACAPVPSARFPSCVEQIEALASALPSRPAGDPARNSAVAETIPVGATRDSLQTMTGESMAAPRTATVLAPRKVALSVLAGGMILVAIVLAVGRRSEVRSTSEGAGHAALPASGATRLTAPPTAPPPTAPRVPEASAPALPEKVVATPPPRAPVSKTKSRGTAKPEKPGPDRIWEEP